MRIYLPIADGMSVPEYAAIQEVGVHFDQAFGVNSTAHVVDIRFACTLQPRIVGTAEGVKYPCQLVVCLAPVSRSHRHGMYERLAWIFIQKRSIRSSCIIEVRLKREVGD